MRTTQQLFDLTGRTALITGGSRGIGAATANLLARAGASVAITYATNRRAALETIDAIRSEGGIAHAFQARAESYTECRKAISQKYCRTKG